MNENAALLLRDFANTLDVEESADALGSPADLAAWLDERDLNAPDPDAPDPDTPDPGTPGPAAEPDLGNALALREALRAAMAAHHDGGEGDPAALDAALRPYPLRVGHGPGGPRLLPAAGDPAAWLAAALVEARSDGTWIRLKICPAEDCRWSFLDTSRNRSRTWCDMKVCGNRTKTRAYRARRTPGPGPTQ
ncbi:CGNR zinc finger domain-containing protein [Actinocorallia longicatena]